MYGQCPAKLPGLCKIKSNGVMAKRWLLLLCMAAICIAGRLNNSTMSISSQLTNADEYWACVSSVPAFSVYSSGDSGKMDRISDYFEKISLTPYNIGWGLAGFLYVALAGIVITRWWNRLRRRKH